MMTFANRMLERVPKTSDDLLADEMVQWTDNADPAAWYYLAVQETTNSHHYDYHTIEVDADDGDYDFEDEGGNRFRYDWITGLDFPYEYWIELMENRD